MPKALEDTVGNLEYVLLLLTFLGVLYLVAKDMGINVSRNSSSAPAAGAKPAEGFNLSASALGFNSQSTGATHGASRRDGFSMSGNEHPLIMQQVFRNDAGEPIQDLSQLEADAWNTNFNSDSIGSNDGRNFNVPAKARTQDWRGFEMNTEGMRANRFTDGGLVRSMVGAN